MRKRSLALVALCLLPNLAFAQDAQVKTEQRPDRPPPKWGLMLDAGVPDGVNGSLVGRPLSFLRLHVGAGKNMISTGVRAGVTLLPFGAGPSLTLEGGHYFDGNANGLARMLTGPDHQNKAALERVGYSYGNAHLGLDFGRRWVTFYLHGGLSYIRMGLHDVETLFTDAKAGMGSPLTFKKDPIVRVVAPSAKAGLVVYFR